jgi:hypothetical protein
VGQPNAKRAFHAAFGALGYTYVSYPNGPKLNTPASPIPAETLWYSLHTLSSQPNARGLGDATIRYQGLFQVTIRAPVTDTFGNPFGTYLIDAAAETIATAFKLGTQLGYPLGNPTVYAHCGVPETIDLGNIEPEWYTVVVRIPFWLDN